MRLPKSWKGFGDLTQFNATVNGQPLSGRSLAIDPFSFPDAMVVHYLVHKNDIIKLAEEIDSNSSSSSNAAAGSIKKTNAAGLMKFTLSPAENAAACDKSKSQVFWKKARRGRSKIHFCNEENQV